MQSSARESWGADHAHIIADDLPGAALRVVCDASGERTRKVADDCGAADIASVPIETIRRKDVDAVLLTKECGVERVALELHGSQCVYNVPSLLKLRTAIGPVVGANLDPSHLFWMGADPLVATEALGEAVYHVHAKDRLLNAPVQATTSLLENGSLMNIPARSRSYITLGFGHGEQWQRQFCYRLRMAGYDGLLSVEHEDVLLNSVEGLENSIALLKGAMPGAESDFKPQAI